MKPDDLIGIGIFALVAIAVYLAEGAIGRWRGPEPKAAPPPDPLREGDR